MSNSKVTIDGYRENRSSIFFSKLCIEWVKFLLRTDASSFLLIIFTILIIYKEEGHNGLNRHHFTWVTWYTMLTTSSLKGNTLIYCEGYLRYKYQNLKISQSVIRIVLLVHFRLIINYLPSEELFCYYWVKMQIVLLLCRILSWRYTGLLLDYHEEFIRINFFC